MPRARVVEVHDDPETRHPIFDLSRVGKTTLLKRLVTRQPKGVRLRTERDASTVPISHKNVS